MTFLAIVVLAFSVMPGCEEPLDPREPGMLVPMTVDEDASLPSIFVNNTQLHAETFGDPAHPMIVVLHGGPGSDYRSLLDFKDLAESGYFVVFYDQRGSGLSKRHKKSAYSIQVMLDDLDAVINHYRTSPAQKIFLFGHSWGGMLATAYINQNPGAISGAILAEPGGFNWTDAKNYIKRTQNLKLISEQTTDILYPDQLLSLKENDHEVLDYKRALASINETGAGNMLGNAGPSPFWRYGAVINESLTELAEKEGFDFTTNLQQYDTKVLFAYSELNRAYGSQHAQMVSSAYPNVELVEIKGAGHEMIYFGCYKLYPATLNYLNNLN